MFEHKSDVSCIACRYWRNAKEHETFWEQSLEHMSSLWFQSRKTRDCPGLRFPVAVPRCPKAKKMARPRCQAICTRYELTQGEERECRLLIIGFALWHVSKDLKSTEGRGQARWLKWQDAVSNLRYAGGL